jgi:hypothetical protein
MAILELKTLPRTRAVGKKIVSFVAGFQGLGIEAIDHHIESVEFEGMPKKPEEATPVSITAFMYRTPPYDLARPEEEIGYDEEITKMLGPRYSWFVKPKNARAGVWDEVWNQIQPTRKSKPIAMATYNQVYGIIVPKSITLVDLSRRSLHFEFEKPLFYLKMGSEKIREAVKDITTDRELLNSLIQIEKESAPPRPGMRFDYVHFCYIGRGISTDPFDRVCPFTSCPARPDRICDGKKLWSGTYFSRKQFPKVYPLRTMMVSRATGTPTLEEYLPRKILSVKAYNDQRINTFWYGVEIAAWFMKVRPIVRIYFDDFSKPGYVIPTSTLNILLSPEWLDEQVRKILRDKAEVRSAIALKKVINESLGKFFDYKRLTSTVEGLIARSGETWKRYKRYIGGEIDDELLTFARACLLHSLEHMFSQYVLHQLAGVDFNFVITRSYPQVTPNVVLAENARNGNLGIVDTVVKKIDEEGLPSFLIDFLTWLTNTIDFHVRTFDEVARRRREEAERVLKHARTTLEPKQLQGLQEVNEKVGRFKEELSAVTEPFDITLARLILLVGRRIGEEEMNRIEELFDDILEAQGFPICWDGCNACVRMERYCNEGTKQIVTTSRRLLREFAQMLLNLIRSGYTESTDRAGEIIEPILFSAKKEALIASPYISPRYAEKIIELARRGASVKVITWRPMDKGEEYGFQDESLKKLEDSRKAYPNLELKVLEKLHHLKMYVVDRRISITGSANLTDSGLYRNVEHVHVKLDPDAVAKDKADFMAIWKA